MSSAHRERQRRARHERQLRRAVEAELRRRAQVSLQTRREFDMAELDSFTSMVSSPLPKVRRNRRR